MSDTCDYHEKTRELIGELVVRVSLAEQKATAAQKEIESMQEQSKELMLVVAATKQSVSNWGLSFYVVGAAIGIIYELRDPIARLLGWL